MSEPDVYRVGFSLKMDHQTLYFAGTFVGLYDPVTNLDRNWHFRKVDAVVSRGEPCLPSSLCEV